MKGIRIIYLGCVLMLGSCQTVENIGYWNQDSSDSTGEETEPGTEPTDSGTMELESDTPETDSDTSETTEDTTVPSETEDPSDTGSDSESEDTETSDSESDTNPAYVTVPFQPDEPTAGYIFTVSPSENILELPGAWLTYADMSSFNTSTMTAANDICLKGTVSQSSSGFFFPTTYAGVSITPCPEKENVFHPFPMRECPYTQATERITFVGISYFVEGENIPNELKLRIFFPATDYAITITRDVESGLDAPRDYLFETMFDITDDQTDPSNITMLQLTVDGSFTKAVEFDFCIRDFALLIAEK